MPGRDKTGPQGQGAMTGRGLGACATESAANATDFSGNNPLRRGRGGKGRGLQDQIDNLQNQLAEIHELLKDK